MTDFTWRCYRIHTVRVVSVWLMLFLCILGGGAQQVPDYSDPRSWFQPDSVTGDKAVDVFYIVPTCVSDWKSSSGKMFHHMDIYNEKQRNLVAPSILLGKRIFAGTCNFFSPYYRQVTMQSWMMSEDSINARYAIAREDVIAAFEYYMKHYNNGRPFILAGHSQGAKSVIELLKTEINTENADRLVAAYAIGFAVIEPEATQYPYLKAAKDSVDTGVTICYNSVSSPEAISPVLKKNVWCINPINWRTDATPAFPRQNPGTVFLNKDGSVKAEYAHTIGAYVDTVNHVLIVNGTDPDAYYLPAYADLFPKGNYHIQELNFYFRSLQKNVGDRIRAYLKQ